MDLNKFEDESINELIVEHFFDETDYNSAYHPDFTENATELDEKMLESGWGWSASKITDKSILVNVFNLRGGDTVSINCKPFEIDKAICVALLQNLGVI